MVARGRALYQSCPICSGTDVECDWIMCRMVRAAMRERLDDESRTALELYAQGTSLVLVAERIGRSRGRTRQIIATAYDRLK